MNPSATGIDDLPSEMIRELFEYLPPKDLATCSLINKRWYSIYASFKLQRLAAIDYHPDSYQDDPIKYYDSNRAIEEDRCCLAMFGRLTKKPLLSNLKYLVLVNRLKFDLNELNQFQQLVHLEIKIKYSDGKVHLNLPKLKVLAFYYFRYSYGGCSLSIDCPQLSTLRYPRGKDDTLLKVKHPETIRKLQTDMVGEKLAAFKSVECLVTEEFGAISEATLLSLPKLRELRCIRDIYFFALKEPTEVVLLKKMLSEFVDNVKELRGGDFRFSFSGFPITKRTLEQIDFNAQVNGKSGYGWLSNQCVYTKNYHLIEEGALDFVHRVNYNCLLSGVTGEFPRCFPQKFTGVQSIVTNSAIEDPEHLLWFLKSLRFLRSLILEDTKLGQAFYDQLPVSAPLLLDLQLRNRHCENELQMNFDFIGTFSCLSHLGISPKLRSPESVTSLVRWLGKLKNCEFSCSTRR